MDIERWFETKPSQVVNEIALEKKFIWFAIHNPKALNFREQDYIIKDINTMARKVKNARTDEPQITDRTQKKATPNSGSGKSQTRWANIDIRSKEHKERIRDMAKSVDFVLDTIVELVDDGYDLHVKRTDEGSTVTAMLFARSGVQCAGNAGLSASAPDAWLSLSSLVYKHVHICEGVWFSDVESDEDDNWR